MEIGQWIQLGVIVVLILLSAFFSSAETALTTVNRLRVRTLAEEGNKNAIVLEKVIENTGKMLSAILIGNNIVNISASSLATIFTTNVFGSASVGIMTGLLTIIVLIFGEISPKTIATIHAENIALKYARVISIIMVIFTPLIFIVGHLADGVLMLLHVDKGQKKNLITETELRTMVDVGHEEGIIEKEEHEIINNVFDIGDVAAREIMVPRIDMVLVDVNSSYDELMKIFEECKYTRIPVYEESTDNVIGIINMKDILFYKQGTPFSLRNYLREPLYTYEGKNVSELLVEMKKTAVNLSIVLDEYGDTAGLVTLEDILEEIVGEIRDEYDGDEEDGIRRIDEQTYLVDGSMDLDDINDELGTSFESENYDSIGGLMIEHFDRLPEIGEEILIDSCRLKVLQMGKNRIEKVKIKISDTKKSAKE